VSISSSAWAAICAFLVGNVALAVLVPEKPCAAMSIVRREHYPENGNGFPKKIMLK